MAMTDDGGAGRNGLLSRFGMLGAGLLALSLTGCGFMEPDIPPPCPQVFPVAEARELVRFTGQGRDLTDILFEAQLQDVALVCELNDGTLEADLRVRIIAIDGPANPTRVARLAYFVAIATRDNQILAREEFDLSVPFEGNRTRVLAEEEVSPRIPLQPGQTGADFIVYVGLALTPAELQYNRENR